MALERKRQIKLIVWGLILLFGISVLLGGEYLAYRICEKFWWKRADFNHAYNREATGRQGAYIAPIDFHFVNVRRLHPSFGHVFVEGNNYGFLSSIDYPYSKAPDEIVVGILGGSTAMHFAEWMERTQDWQKRHFKFAPDKKIVVLNYALSGFQQPQQFHVFARFMEGLDVVVSLDGWNEAYAKHCPNEPGLPQGYEFLFGREVDAEVLNQFRRYERFNRIFSALLQDSWLGQSHIVHLGWRRMIMWTQSRAYALFEAEQRKDRKKVFSECEVGRDQVNYGLWKKYSQLTSELAQRHGVRYFHFLQPTPYIEGAKPLSAEEDAIVAYREMINIKESSAYDFIRFYKLFKGDPQRFAGTHDLTYLFKDTSEIMYLDRFTHLNQMGYQKLAEYIWGVIEFESKREKK